MTKNFLTGFERENLSLTQEYECMQCFEPITNPICHECLGNRINTWLGLYPNIKKKMSPKIKSYVRDVSNNTLKSVNCMACNKKKAALCPYCFTEGVFDILKNTKIDRMIVMDFLSTFNFDLKHEGYIAEAVKEGLY